MMAEKVTSFQVAERAGVSQSAVSRVFTPGASVSRRTAEKVRKAAAELGYRPNNLARAMASGRSRIIGLVVAYLDNQFYPTALEKLSTALQDHGYHILIFMASNDDDGVQRVVSELLDYQLDGIILASVGLSNDLAQRCRAAGIPVILFNRSQDIDGICAVTSDNLAGGRKVADFLIAGGHERIAYIAGWQGASTQRDREAGFRMALAAAGRDLHARALGEYDSDKAADAARQMFGPPDRPDAVFVANDHMALAVMDVLRHELCLRVPEDVSVVGYDDVPPAAWLSYRLTTVRQRANRMVEETVSTLLAQIEAPQTQQFQHLSLDGQLIIRESARIPAHWPRTTP